MIEVIAGIAIAVVIIILSRALSKYFSTRLFATTVLVAIAFIYVGFSLKGNPPNLIILEAGIAVGLYFMALIGFTRDSVLIAYGIIFHGVWDIFHHNGLILKTDIPLYWPSFCFIIDIIDGFYFLFVFRNEKSATRPHKN